MPIISVFRICKAEKIFCHDVLPAHQSTSTSTTIQPNNFLLHKSFMGFTFPRIINANKYFILYIVYIHYKFAHSPLAFICKFNQNIPVNPVQYNAGEEFMEPHLIFPVKVCYATFLNTLSQ